MANDLWLPKRYKLADGSRIRSLLFSGEEWQIFCTHGTINVLIVRPELGPEMVRGRSARRVIV